MKVIKHKDKWYLQSDTGYKEILLSTDTELQKDGVQAIDDEFLEWFVKNTSCEKVEVQCSGRNCIEEYGCTKEVCNGVKPLKIIIPKEEPTMIDDWLDEHGDPEIYKKVEKQLELEEAAINFYREFPSNPLDKPEWHYNRDVDCFKKRKAFINGAKYMAEKMYSEEQLFKILLDFVEFPHDHNEGRGSIINRFLMELKKK